MMKVPCAAATTTIVSFLCSSYSSRPIAIVRQAHGCRWRPSLSSLSTTTRNLVSLHGDTNVTTACSRQQQTTAAAAPRDSTTTKRRRRRRRTLGLHEAGERPPDPQELLSPNELAEKQGVLIDWLLQRRRRRQSTASGAGVLCLTGAGISTESGVPDYRGFRGSYHAGHKPVIHDQFMKSPHQRQRYWARGMIGWRSFANRQPAAGHVALVELERLGIIGVEYPDRAEFYKNAASYYLQTSSTSRKLAVVTQNVDGLHRRAAGNSQRALLELHGRTDQLECMQCGHVKCRHEFHDQLEDLNRDWYQQASSTASTTTTTTTSLLRPDGDAAVEQDDFSHIQVPSCPVCKTGFFKPKVVFFGDSVPAHRVAQVRAAVEQCATSTTDGGGLLVVGSSLAVHSAYRHVREASRLGVPIAILNVGETRAQVEGLEGDILHVEAPAGPTLQGVAEYFTQLARDEMNGR